MPIDPSKILQSIRRNAGLEETEPLIQMESPGGEPPSGSDHEPLIESAGESYRRPISICFAGVGTCGVNILISLKEKKIENSIVNFIGINSDGASIIELEKHGLNNNIALGTGDSYYLGAGGDLEHARKLGEKYEEKFEKQFKNVDLALVVTGMGGGTGTGVAPIVARAARKAQEGNRNKLTIGVAAMPAGIEAGRYDLAKQGIEELKKYVDALVVIDQRNILDVLEEEDASADQVDELIDSRFHIVLQSIMNIVTTYTKRHIDFADICSTLKSCGDAIITTVDISSENVDEMKKALEKAVNDKLLIDHSDKIASRLLVHHFYGKNYSQRNHYEVVNEVQKLFGWTKKPDGLYRCIIEDPSENILRFEKFSGASSEEYNGKNRVIVMAGGFEEAISKEKTMSPTQRMETLEHRPFVPPPPAPEPELATLPPEPIAPPPEAPPQVVKKPSIGDLLRDMGSL
ncbi:MAG: hypothetical protein LBC85_11205 [Fibromonadaceae bacterium]|jgi:cell division protein FtsZ|nr:hypothetical protein [Fibromonadaceae bacterium]